MCRARADLAWGCCFLTCITIDFLNCVALITFHAWAHFQSWFIAYWMPLEVSGIGLSSRPCGNFMKINSFLCGRTWYPGISWSNLKYARVLVQSGSGNAIFAGPIYPVLWREIWKRQLNDKQSAGSTANKVERKKWVKLTVMTATSGVVAALSIA